MKNNKSSKRINCLCGSGAESQDCCLSIINGLRLAQNAEQLMRSRYLAYVLGNAEYVLASWHKSTRPNELNLSDQVKWRGLKVLAFDEDKPNAAFVEFVAEFTNDGLLEQMHERSRFLHEEGAWYYVEGEQLAAVESTVIELPGRNDPCCCGSARKFKKCCGA